MGRIQAGEEEGVETSVRGPLFAAPSLRPTLYIFCLHHRRARRLALLTRIHAHPREPSRIFSRFMEHTLAFDTRFTLEMALGATSPFLDMVT